MDRIIFLLSCFLIVSCSATKNVIDNRVSLSSRIDQDKWMVLCLSNVSSFRKEFELETKQQLIFHDVHAATSIEYLPKELKKDIETKNRLEDFVSQLPENGFSMLIISTMGSVERTKLDAEGYFGDFTLYHYITNVYSLENNDSQPIWSMCLCVYDYQLNQLTLSDMVHAIVAEMAKDEIIPQIDSELLELYHL